MRIDVYLSERRLIGRDGEVWLRHTLASFAPIEAARWRDAEGRAVEDDGADRPYLEIEAPGGSEVAGVGMEGRLLLPPPAQDASWLDSPCFDADEAVRAAMVGEACLRLFRAGGGDL
jgi:hypothetical protein